MLYDSFAKTHVTAGLNPMLRLKNRLEYLQSYLVLLYALVLPLPITVPWVVLILGIVTWAVIVALEFCTDKRTSAWQKIPPLTLPIVLFLIAVTMSATINNGVKELLPAIFSFRGLIVYFWAYQAFVRNPELKSSSLQCLLLVGAAAGVWAMIQQLTGFHPFTYNYLQGTGFLSGPMAFAGQMQIFSLLALAIFFRKGYENFWKPLRQRLVFAVITIANVIGVIFASERSAWLGAICGVVLISVLISFRSLFKTISVLLVSGGIGWFLIPVFQKRLLTLTAWHEDVSVRVRFKLWDEAIRIFQSHPWFGTGILKFPRFHIPEALVPGRSLYLDHAHSNYLHLLATTGLIGTTAYLWLCWSMLHLAWLNMRIWEQSKVELTQSKISPEVPGFGLGILGAMVSLMVAGIFEYNFGTGQVRLTQWFVLAMLTCTSTLSPLSKHATGNAT